MADPTIKIASCRSDGRCPECCLSLQERGGRLSLLPLPSCGCHCCPEHERGHLKGLLAEALRKLSERTNADIQRGISYVLSIRCMRHHNVPQMNASEARGGECAACAVESTNQVLATIRTHEMVAEERAKRMEEERDAAVEAQKRHLNEATEAVHDLGAKLDAVIRERDEARAQVRAFQRAAEASVERQRGDAAIYQRNKERERAERAEALLRECLYPLTDRGYPTEALVAKIKGLLS